MMVVEGVLERFGEGSATESSRFYSILHVGDNIIRNVSAPKDVASYLDLGVNLRVCIHKFFLGKNFIMSVEHIGGMKIKIGFGSFLQLLFALLLGGLFMALIFCFLFTSVVVSFFPYSVNFLVVINVILGIFITGWQPYRFAVDYSHA
jgi:hypothetical protein